MQTIDNMGSNPSHNVQVVCSGQFKDRCSGSKCEQCGFENLPSSLIRSISSFLNFYELSQVYVRINKSTFYSSIFNKHYNAGIVKTQIENICSIINNNNLNDFDFYQHKASISIAGIGELNNFFHTYSIESNPCTEDWCYFIDNLENLIDSILDVLYYCNSFCFYRNYLRFHGIVGKLENIKHKFQTHKENENYRQYLALQLIELMFILSNTSKIPFYNLVGIVLRSFLTNQMLVPFRFVLFMLFDTNNCCQLTNNKMDIQKWFDEYVCKKYDDEKKSFIGYRDIFYFEYLIHSTRYTKPLITKRFKQLSYFCTKPNTQTLQTFHWKDEYLFWKSTECFLINAVLFWVAMYLICYVVLGIEFFFDNRLYDVCFMLPFVLLSISQVWGDQKGFK